MENTIQPSSWNNFTIGDEVISFNDVYKTYSSSLFEHCYRITKDHEVSSEIVDFVLMKVSRVRPVFKTTGDFRNFVFKSCANRSKDFLRAEKRRFTTFISEFQPFDFVSRSIEDVLIARDKLNQALKVVDAMPVGMQAILVHSLFDDRSPKEIAALLNVPETSVRTQKSQAIKRIKSTLLRD